MTSTKLPNPLEHIDNVTDELRQYKKWNVYELVLTLNGSLRKFPQSWNNLKPANVHLPINQGTFAQCLEAARNGGPQYGVGIVLEPGCGLWVPDVDYRSANDPVALKAKTLELLERYPTLHETSISGNGMHLYYSGNLPPEFKFKIKGLHAYGATNQFIAVTGRDMAGIIQSGDALINDATEAYAKLEAVADSYVPHDIEHVDYDSFDEVLAVGSRFLPGGGDLLELLKTPVHEQGGPWVQTLGRITMALCSARLTKDEAFNILEASPFVLQSGPDAEGKSRLSKVTRLFWKGREWESAFKNCSQRNAFVIPKWMLDHGRALVASWDAHKAKEQAANQLIPIANGGDEQHQPKFTERVEREVYGALRNVDAAIQSRLTLPPGVSFQMCCELGEAVANPRLEYVLPAQLFGLSATFGRKYKDGEEPLTLHILSTGLMHTGKTRILTRLAEFYSNSAAHIDADPTDRAAILIPTSESATGSGFKLPDGPPVHSYIEKKRHKSAQQLHFDLMMSGCAGYIIDEAGALARQLFSDDHLSLDLKAYLKEAWDAGHITNSLTPPLSKDGARNKAQSRIYNANMALAATCTSDELERMSLKELADGFWSRWLVLFDDKPTDIGKANKVSGLRKAFSPDIGNLTRQWMAAANALDREYNPEAETALPGETDHINASRLHAIARKHVIAVQWADDAAELMDEFELVFDRIVHRAQKKTGNDRLPPWYQLFARSGNMSRRIACLLAVSDNHLAPFVNPDHVRWAVEYVSYLQATLLSAQERGIVAIGLDAATDIIATHLKRRGGERAWVSTYNLWDSCRYQFSQIIKNEGIRAAARDYFNKVLKDAVEDGILKRARVVPQEGSNSVDCVRIDPEHPHWIKLKKVGLV